MVKKKHRFLPMQPGAKKLEFTVFWLTHPEKQGKIRLVYDCLFLDFSGEVLYTYLIFRCVYTTYYTITKRRSLFMANNQEPIRRNDVIRCEKCGEDYSVTYKRCPFCDERPNRSRRAEGGTVKTNSGRRVAGGAQGGYGRSVNPLQVAGVVGSLVLIIAALYIVFSVVSPLLGNRDNPSSSQSQPPASSSQSPSISAPVEDPGTSGDISTPEVVEPVVIPANSIKLGPDPKDFTLRANESFKLTITVDPSNATVVWSSSDESAAMAGQDGTVYNVNTGSSKKVVTITATSGDKTAECIVRCNGGSSGTNVPPTVTPGTTPSTPTTPTAPDPVTPSAPTTPSTGSGLAVGSAGKVSGAGSGLNVRTGPGSSYERIASLSNGSDVKILDNSDSSWYKISFSGVGGKTTEGYVSKDFIVAR